MEIATLITIHSVGAPCRRRSTPPKRFWLYLFAIKTVKRRCGCGELEMIQSVGDSNPISSILVHCILCLYIHASFVELYHDNVEWNAFSGPKTCPNDSPCAGGWQALRDCPQGSGPPPLYSSFGSGLSSTVGQVSSPHCSCLKQGSQTRSS